MWHLMSIGRGLQVEGGMKRKSKELEADDGRKPRFRKLTGFRWRTAIFALEDDANFTGINSSVDLSRRWGIKGVDRR